MSEGCGPTASSHLNAVAVPDDPIGQPVLDRLAGIEEAVAFHVLVHAVDRLAGVARIDLVDALAELEDLARVDLHVGGLALEARRRLVDQTRLLGSTARLPAVPPASSGEPIDIATPTHVVRISGLMNCIAS